MFKYFIFLLTFCFSFNQAISQEKLDIDSVEIILIDSTMEGYLFEFPKILPFSPVIEPVFNLPNNSIIDICFTDTLLQDTVWIVENELFAKGCYRILNSVFFKYSNFTRERICIIHFVAKSTALVGGRAKILFQVESILSLR